jgi:hypothetical protein
MLNAADVQGAQLLCSWAARNYHYWYANWWHPQSFAASVPNNANKSQFIKISWPNLDDRWQCVKQDSLNWGHSYVHPSMTQIFQNVKGMVTWADKKHGASSVHLDALGFLIGLYTYQRNGNSRMRAPNGVKLYMWICFKQREGKIGAYDNPHFSSRPMKCDGSKHKLCKNVFTVRLVRTWTDSIESNYFHDIGTQGYWLPHYTLHRIPAKKSFPRKSCIQKLAETLFKGNPEFTVFWAQKNLYHTTWGKVAEKIVHLGCCMGDPLE